MDTVVFEKNPPQDPTLKQVNPAHIIIYRFFYIRVWYYSVINILFFQVLLPSRLPDQMAFAILSNPRILHAHLILLKLIIPFSNMFVPYEQRPSFMPVRNKGKGKGVPRQAEVAQGVAVG